MSTQENLDWDEVLGAVENQEQEEKNDPNSKSDFEAIPAGPYEVVVQEADKQTAKSSGNDMIKVRLQVTNGPYANRVLFGYIVFSTGNPKAMRITLDKLGAFGVSRELIATQKPSVAQIAELLVGQRAIARVGIQDSGEYKGSNEVKGFKPPAGGAQPVAQTAAAAPKPTGVPNIPAPEEQAPAPAAPAPVIPTPDVPVDGADAEEPF